MSQSDLNINGKEILLNGNRVFLRSLKVSDATQEYVDWLNNPDVNQFLESRFERHTLESVRNYIQKARKDPRVIFLAIIRREDDKHIGNIKSGPIDQNHKRSDIGFMIGDKASWGKGYMTESIDLFSRYLFDTVKLHKIIAGAYENNPGSINALKKCGFYEEARLKRHASFKGEFIDVVLLAKINEKIE